MTHPPALVQRVARILRSADQVCPPLNWMAAAENVLDALVVQAPTVTTEHGGRIRLDWPDGIDPDRNPADGVQHVLVDARLLDRLVDQLNDRGAALDLIREQYQTPIEQQCGVIRAFAWGAGGVFCMRRRGHAGPHFNHGQEWE